MNLTVKELRDFILFLEELENTNSESDTVEISIDLYRTRSWWQQALITPLEYDITAGLPIRVSKADLRSYILFVYHSESVQPTSELIDIQALSGWQKNSTEQMRQSDSLLYVKYGAFRVEKMRQIKKRIRQLKPQPREHDFWFSRGANMEKAILVFPEPDPSVPLVMAALDSQHATRHLVDHFKNVNLKLNPRDFDQHGIAGANFSSNRDFWNAILQVPHMTSLGLVRLVGFQISDWFPRTPGLYHTKAAEECRTSSAKHLAQIGRDVFYKPIGKGLLLRGGIGSVRFKPIRVPAMSNDEYWLCTATSDEYVHTGVPLAIPDRLMPKVDFRSVYTVIGRIKFLPNVLEPYFSHMTGIQQIYLLVDEIEKSSASRELPYITPMVFFSSRWKAVMEDGLAGFTTFVTCHSNPQELDNAVKWLTEYVKFYRGEIITNFDEQSPWFENVPFGLNSVMTGKVDLQHLQDFIRKIAGEITKIDAAILDLYTTFTEIKEIESTLADILGIVSAQAELTQETKLEFEIKITELRKEIAKSKPNESRVRAILSFFVVYPNMLNGRGTGG
ncbi:MAG: hypothetical protein FJZ94_06920 [Chloroflexi bacterium]|nr:hypothetical protein [Chloroflexota bacterium]